MASSGTHAIAQGVTRTIRVSKLRDHLGELLDPTGWTIHGVARSNTVSGATVAEWHSTPTGTQGAAEVVDADPNDPEIGATVQPGEKWIYLHITPAMSDAWGFESAVLHCEIKEPVSPFREERIADVVIINDRTTVRE